MRTWGIYKLEWGRKRYVDWVSKSSLRWRIHPQGNGSTRCAMLLEAVYRITNSSRVGSEGLGVVAGCRIWHHPPVQGININLPACAIQIKSEPSAGASQIDGIASTSSSTCSCRLKPFIRPVYRVAADIEIFSIVSAALGTLHDLKQHFVGEWVDSKIIRDVGHCYPLPHIELWRSSQCLLDDDRLQSLGYTLGMSGSCRFGPLSVAPEDWFHWNGIHQNLAMAIAVGHDCLLIMSNTSTIKA